MHKNMTTITRPRKNTQEIFVTFNGVTVDNVNYFNNQNQFKSNLTIKNIKNIQLHKLPIIQRHYSEDDFKKYTNNIKQVSGTQPQIKLQEEYFPQTTISTKKTNRQIKSISKQQKIKKNKQKSIIEPINSKINFGLKQTSSTQSAQNLFKPIPTYVRNRFKNNNNNNVNNINNRPIQFISKKSSIMRIGTVSRQNFKIINKVGQGKFGKVFMVKQIYTGFILAMKVVEIKKIISQNLLQQFIRQLKIQTFLDHPNIISLYGFFSDQTHFYTLMQLGCDGQLYSLILNNKLLSEQSTSFIIKNLLQAISYIHDNKVLHRDMKPQNIVLIMGNVKICDFGWAVNKLHPGELRNTFCGTPLYLSPEILQGSRYDEKVDLWAIGVLTYELYLGCNPFDISSHQDLLKISTQQIKFSECRQISQYLKKFILSILIKNPNQRFTSRQLLKMQFITKYKDFQTCQQLCK